MILPVLDFSTIKNDLFPVIASVFTKTSSLAIKVRGLEAFVILCGGSNTPEASNDGLDGIMNANASKKSSSTALDKYTMQEKIVPLVRAIKTKEPAVAMASLNVLRQVGGVADADFVAMDILPVLWSMSLGPLLDLSQFQSFMELIKSLSSRVEVEQTKKLQELSGTKGSNSARTDDFMSFGATNAFPPINGASDAGEVDFERLVKGDMASNGSTNPLDGGWDTVAANPKSPAARSSMQSQAPAFSWSTPSPTTPAYSAGSMSTLQPQQPGPAPRTITPDLSRFDALAPSSTQFSKPLQPQSAFNTPLQPQTNIYNSNPVSQPVSGFQTTPSANWGAATQNNPWSSNASSQSSFNAPLSPRGNLGNAMSNMSLHQQRPAVSTQSSFSLPPPPGATPFGMQQSSMTSPPARPAFGQPPQQSSFPPAPGTVNQAKPPAQKSGLDAYESLL